MEFSHFFNSTPASGLTIRYEDLYPGLNFSANTAGNITAEEIGSAADENFTSIFTYTKARSDAEILLSNYSSLGGFTLGLTAGNYLYIDYHGTLDQAHIYKDITLGTKNCLVVKKAGQSFAIYRYDLLSRAFNSIETFAFSPDANLNPGQDLAIAGVGSNYTGRYGNNKIKYFNGIFDQFVYISGAIEDSYLLSILSGFLPATLSASSSYASTLLDESYRFPEGYYSTGYTQLASYFSGINQSIITGSLPTGIWRGTGVGTISSGGLTGSISYGTGFDACYSTGNFFSTIYTGAGTGVYTTFTDTVRVVKNNLTTISHNLVFTRSGITDFHVDYDAAYRVEVSTGSVLTYDDTYYTGFKMDGVVSETISTLTLATDTGVAPTGYNIRGLYDNAQNLFAMPGWSAGRLLYNGTGSLDYIQTGVYVDISGFTEISTDYMIGDNNNSSTLLYFGTDHWATGKFYSNAAFVTRSAAPVGRAKQEEYKETSNYHLYHQSTIQPSGSTFFFQL